MKKNSSGFLPRILGASSLLLAISLLSQPAQAGFQWVPSSGQGQPNVYQNQVAVAPTVRSAPVPSVQRAQRAASPFEAMPTIQVEGEARKVDGPQASESGPTSMTAEAVAVEDAAPPAASAMSAALPDKPVRGFANNVPLSVALRQILPQEYGYSMAPDVSLNKLVSWKGSDSWRRTLGDVLRGAGLEMQEKGQVIHISRAASGMNEVVEAGSPRTTVRPVARVGAAPSIQSLKAGGSPMSLGTLTNEEAETLEPSMTDAPASMVGRGQARHSDVAMSGDWQANRGETLHKVLERWGRKSNIDVVWQAEYDYPLQASVSLGGGFEEAVRALLSGFQEAKPQPIATLHAGASGGATVLVVSVRGNNYSE